MAYHVHVVATTEVSPHRNKRGAREMRITQRWRSVIGVNLRIDDAGDRVPLRLDVAIDSPALSELLAPEPDLTLFEDVPPTKSR